MRRGKIDSSILIDKTSQLFTQAGYHNTTMDDIAKACNIQKSSLYHHIPSRKSLVLMIMNHVIAITKKELDCAYLTNLTAKEHLNLLISAIERLAIQTNTHRLISTLAIEIGETIPEVVELTQLYFEEWVKAISTFLSAFNDPQKAHELALDMVAHIHGGITLAKIMENPLFFTRAIRQLERLSSDSVSAQKAT